MFEARLVKDGEIKKEDEIRLARYKQDSIYFSGNQDKLKEKYSGMHVAVFNLQVVDYDKKLELLSARLRSKYGEKESIMIGYVWEKPVHTILPASAA